MDIKSKEEFIYFMQRACEDTYNDCYIELYNILLRSFISADVDFDGQVSEDEFGGMISSADAFPKKFGFEWWAGSGKDQFKAIDETAMEAFPLTNGSTLPTNTTNPRSFPLLSINRRKMRSSKIAKTPQIQDQKPTRRSTGSAGSASKLLMPTETARSQTQSLPL